METNIEEEGRQVSLFVSDPRLSLWVEENLVGLVISTTLALIIFFLIVGAIITRRTVTIDMNQQEAGDAIKTRRKFLLEGIVWALGVSILSISINYGLYQHIDKINIEKQVTNVVTSYETVPTAQARDELVKAIMTDKDKKPKSLIGENLTFGAQGNVVLQFTPVKNGWRVSAIQVEPTE